MCTVQQRDTSPHIQAQSDTVSAFYQQGDGNVTLCQWNQECTRNLPGGVEGSDGVYAIMERFDEELFDYMEALKIGAIEKPVPYLDK